MTEFDLNSAFTASAVGFAAAHLAFVYREEHLRKLDKRLQPLLTDRLSHQKAQFLENPFNFQALRGITPYICGVKEASDVCASPLCWANAVPVGPRHEAFQIMIRFKCLHTLAISPIKSQRAIRAIHLPSELMRPRAFDRVYAALGIP